PASVTTLEDNSFECASLSTLRVHWQDPDNVYTNIGFLSVDKSICILYVPFGTKEKYMYCYPWNRFQNIIEDEANQISTVDNQNPYSLLKINENVLTLNEADENSIVSIYNVQGKLLKSFMLKPELNTIDQNIPPGVYLVNVKNKNK